MGRTYTVAWDGASTCIAMAVRGCTAGTTDAYTRSGEHATSDGGRAWGERSVSARDGTGTLKNVMRWDANRRDDDVIIARDGTV